MRYVLTTTYDDGMVSRFVEDSPMLLLKQMTERVNSNERESNVTSWFIEPEKVDTDVTEGADYA